MKSVQTASSGKAACSNGVRGDEALEWLRGQVLE